MPSISPERWRWFPEARFGLFLHWGPYAQFGRGEQVLFRERMDQQAYAAAARAWQPRHFDARQWAAVAVRAGMKYAVLTARHHDGYCLWQTNQTDYSSATQAAGKDYVREYVEAFRSVGLRVGLYYSLADWRIPAYWDGPVRDPGGWARFRAYVHEQVRELLTRYGKIDTLWFDGAWPHDAETWGSRELVTMIRQLQPDILINNRLGALPAATLGAGQTAVDGGMGAGESATLGDFGTPEHTITPDPQRLWESCQTSTWRLWGYAGGERWRPADVLLDMLVEAASKGGNLLLNVGPDQDGRIPAPFVERMSAIGAWLETHGEAIYGAEAGEVCEFITHGRQTRKGNNLYLILRFWDGCQKLTLAGLQTKVQRAAFVTTGQELPFEQTLDHVTILNLPVKSPTPLFPVIRLQCATPPTARPWAMDRLWTGNPARMTPWAAARGSSVYADGKERG